MDFGLSVTALIAPAFIAGVLTFLAPCTLPLVPGYLAFISGVSLSELQRSGFSSAVRKMVFLNGLWYVFGFSLVFMLLGSIFGSLGTFLGQYRLLLGRLGGVVVVFFGLYLMGVVKLPALLGEYRFHLERFLKPGHPTSSFLFGATFAFGWTPCIGPILGSVLLLASQTATALSGAWLLLVFSIGLAVPFLLLAWGVGAASQHLTKLEPYLKVLSVLGGALFVFLGLLLLTDRFGLWLRWAYQLFDFMNYSALLNYL
ncbi:MAG: cytochrome c biogenesis protein CcdA [Candidatus Veblenbacteria bacterium]|nr:cytochrome c biogenesis protein CcdA [Candidatus Veblenbacteria bacterium]